MQFNKLRETPLEILESVDMNRVLEHGGNIRMVLTDDLMLGVDTEVDLNDAKKYLDNDLLIGMYGK